MQENGPDKLQYSYQETLDGIMQVTVEQNNLVNNIQLVFLGVEGVFFVAIVMLFVWNLAKRVSEQRYNMYNCFMQIPIATVRTLATRPINLEDEEDEEDDTPENPSAEQEAQNKEADVEGAKSGQYGGKSFGKSFQYKSDDNADPFFEGGRDDHNHEHRVKHTFFSRTLSILSFGRFKPRKVAPAPGASKRQLQKSNYAAFWIVWPFAIWGLVVIIMNGVNWSQLYTLSADIALLNIINGVLLAHHHGFFFAIELVASGSGVTTVSYHPAPNNVQRLEIELADFREEYSAMLYGGRVRSSFFIYH